MRRTPFEEAALGTTRFKQVLEHAKKLESESQKKKQQIRRKKTKRSGKKTGVKKKPIANSQ
jgi:hypothetical protein